MDANVAYRRNLQQVFYAGSLGTLKILAEVLGPDPEPREADRQAINDLVDEILEFEKKTTQ